MAVYFGEASQPICGAFSASFLQASHNTLKLAVSKRQRVYQVCHITPVCRVRSEHVCFIGVGTELHNQNPVVCSPFVISSTRRTTTNCSASSFCCLRAPSIPTKCSPSKENRCDAGKKTDKVTPHIPPTGAMTLRRKVRALPQNFLHNAQASRFHLLPLSSASRIVSRVHSDDFSSSLYPSLTSFQLPSTIAR